MFWNKSLFRPEYNKFSMDFNRSIGFWHMLGSPKNEDEILQTNTREFWLIRTVKRTAGY